MNIIEITRNFLADCLRQAYEQAASAKLLPPIELNEISIEEPKERSHGDFASNLAMQLTKQAKMNPRLIAQSLVDNMSIEPPIVSVDIAGPGFINFSLEKDWLAPVLSAVQKEDRDYGASNAGGGESVLVEFVSANPTGLLHMGNARGGALGDSLAAVMNKAGYDCQKEYYINDTGNQVKNLGLSVEARYFELLGIDGYELPVDGYHGADIVATAQELVKRHGRQYVDMERETRLREMIDFTLEEKVAGIRTSLEQFGVSFDRWYSERSLHDSGQVEATIAALRERGYIYEKDGAIWLESTRYGEEKDEVLVRSNGLPTYFAADIAYHKDKFDRGYQRLINIWGADHHGHVARMKNAMDALGYDGDRLDVILMQLVHLHRDGEVVRMSKRAGKYVTLEELIDEVGRDAARFFFTMRSPESQMDFDLTLAKSQSADNPVYYVQYAHARICSLLSIAGKAVPAADEINFSLLTGVHEQALLHQIASFPEEVALAAHDYAPYRLAYYAKELANAFHSFYNGSKVLVDDQDVRNARLVLVDAARITLRNVLELIGVSAPERM